MICNSLCYDNLEYKTQVSNVTDKACKLLYLLGQRTSQLHWSIFITYSPTLIASTFVKFYDFGFYPTLDGAFIIKISMLRLKVIVRMKIYHTRKPVSCFCLRDNQFLQIRRSSKYQFKMFSIDEACN